MCRSDTREADDKAAHERRMRETHAKMLKIQELKDHLEAEGVLLPHNEEYICNQNVILSKKSLESVTFPSVPNSKYEYLKEIIDLIKKRMLAVPAIPEVEGKPGTTEPTPRQIAKEEDKLSEKDKEKGTAWNFLGFNNDKKEEPAAPAVDPNKPVIGKFCELEAVVYEKAFTLIDLNVTYSFTAEESEDAKSHGFFINRTEGYTYFGQFREKKFNGKGRQVYEDGSIYEGWFLNGERGPFGRLIFKDGQVYIGEFFHNKPHGVGYYNDMHEIEYKGEYKNGERTGFGVERNITGQCTYEGMFEHDKKEGFGVLLWDDSTKYEGHFKENDFDGKGTYYWKDKRKYEGDWKRNMMHGKGLYTWKGGRYYEGEYVENKKCGNGVFSWNLGNKRYEGQWKDGQQHGEGMLTNYEGEVTKGTWSHGVLISIKNIGNPSPTSMQNNSEAGIPVENDSPIRQPTPRVLPSHPNTNESPQRANSNAAGASK